MEYKLPVSVLVVIHTDDLEVLLLERAARPGFWQSVTGSVDRVDEPLEEAAAREVMEETGIDIRAGRLARWNIVNTFEIYPQWRHRFGPGALYNTEHVFGLRLPARRPVLLSPQEHDAFTWLAWPEAAERCFSWSNRDAIRMLGEGAVITRNVRSRGILAAVLLVAAHALQAARAAEDLVVEAQRQGDSIELRARAMVAAPPSLVWEVLTDYESLPRFIPGITRSIVRARQEGRVVVDQAGEARFLIFSFPLDVRLEVTEAPPGSIASRAVAGNLRRMNGRYEIQPDSAGKSTRLRYDGLIEPDFDLPPLIGVAAMRSMVQEQFTAMVVEIERRAAAGGRK